MIHRRAGKTVFAINKLIGDVLTNPLPRAKGHYFAPTYKQAKSIAWEYLKHYTSHIPGMNYNTVELAARFPFGQTIQLVGGNSVDGFRGQYSDSVVLDELAQMPPRLWSEVVRPALADREGSALFIGTPRGRNAFYDLFERAGHLHDWGRALLTWKQTGILPQREIDALRAEMSEAEFQQEMECSFNAAVRGAYFGKAMADAEAQGRICNVPYDPALPVNTAWDLGVADATAVWFIQKSPGGEERAIDYQEYHGGNLPHIISEIRKLPYKNYGRHIAPHDIRVRELGSGTSRLEVAQQNGLMFDVCRSLPLMDGIEATRNLIPKMWFDDKRCRMGVNHLQLYRAELNEKTGVLSNKPLHDHTSHAADALRMYAIEMGQRSSAWDKPINYDLLDRMAV